MMIAEAFERVSDGSAKPNRELVARQLLKLSGFTGVLGRVSVDAQGIVSTEPSIKVIRRGQAELVTR